MPQMVQGLVGQSGGLSSVPSRFVQPAHGSPRRTHSSDQLDAVPVIDMEGMHAPDQELRSRVVAEIAKACEEWGFFQVSEGLYELCSVHSNLVWIRTHWDACVCGCLGDHPWCGSYSDGRI